MKAKLLMASALVALVTGCSTVEKAPVVVEKAPIVVEKEAVYNETLNPRQKEYPNHLGFNDLHIQAIRHMKPDTHDVNDPKLQIIVHHHCKAYDDGTFICLMFHSGMKDQDKPIGFEYIITTAQYNALPEEEKHYWHYHLVEVPRAHATFPDLTAEEAAKILPAVNETYGKVVYFKNMDDEFPLGEPYIMIVQDMPEQD